MSNPIIRRDFLEYFGTFFLTISLFGAKFPEKSQNRKNHFACQFLGKSRDRGFRKFANYKKFATRTLTKNFSLLEIPHQSRYRKFPASKNFGTRWPTKNFHLAKISTLYVQQKISGCRKFFRATHSHRFSNRKKLAPSACTINSHHRHRIA